VAQWPREGVFVGRVYTQEFRDQIVARHRRDGRTFGEIATEFGLSATSLAKWVREAEKRDRPARLVGGAGGVDRASNVARIAQLERDLTQKNEEVENLGKAWPSSLDVRSGRAADSGGLPGRPLHQVVAEDVRT
jgi:transposase